MLIEPAKRLELARKAAGFESAAAAAKRFGWNYETYAQHENGNRGIKRAATKYAKAFKVGAGWLLYGDGAGPGDDAEALARLQEIYQGLLPEFRAQLLQTAETGLIASEAVRRSKEGTS